MKRVYIKKEVCMGCHLCEVYCQLQHSKSKDLIKTFKKESPPPLPRLRVEVKDSISFAVVCRHCAEPFCVYACLTGALHKDPDHGIVSVDGERCISCWTCLLACPYGVLIKDIQSHMVIKCDLCPGRDVPACVANCPNEALVWGVDDEEWVKLEQKM
jgi:carbon-monoxide dehydrogenase iron sulfur subunit